MATTTYGTWCNRIDGTSPTVEYYVEEAFGSEGTDGYDFEAIVSDYRDAINEALPPSVSLSRNEFIGPDNIDHETEFAGYPLDGCMLLDVLEIVDGIKLWDIIERHEQG